MIYGETENAKSDENVVINAETRRKANVSVLAIVCGIFTAFLASPILAGNFKDLFKHSTWGDKTAWARLGFGLRSPFEDIRPPLRQRPTRRSPLSPDLFY
jgi:hypothetical protein